MDMTQFWDGWDPIVHTVLTVSVGYLALLMLLRITGPRTTAAMTPLDLIMAVTIGSAFGRTITAPDVPITQMLLTLVMLVLLHWVLAWVRRRSPKVRRLVDSQPVLVYYHGEFQHRTMRKHQLVEDDVHTAARQAGLGCMDEVEAVILQQDGALGLITSGKFGSGETVLPYTGEPDGPTDGTAPRR
ncbi:MAG: DUF421 domain-containing protein [Nesterenkonia sp.]|nr:DUF421 domain-containing protein [Nesterenkonia sp.]